MDEAAPHRDSLLALAEDYLTGQIDESRLSELEGRLRDDPLARREFVRYAGLPTDLQFALRARAARTVPGPAGNRRRTYAPVSSFRSNAGSPSSGSSAGPA